MKKILLIGRDGQVGQELVQLFFNQTIASKIKLVALGRPELDLLQANEIQRAIAEIEPDLVINAAAYTAVDKAETEPEMAMAINGIAPGVMAKAVRELGSTLIQLSSDYVFDGNRSTPYLESDLTNPLGIYGQSKLLGEERVQNNCDRHIILRTAWVYGNRGHGNFVKTMLKLGRERDEVRVVSDQIGSPTWAKDIAATIIQLLTAITLSGNEDTNTFNIPPMGIYHYTNSGVASWYDFALAIFEEASSLSIPLKVKQIVPIESCEYPTLAKRPAYSVLAGGKIADALGYSSSHWRHSLKQMLLELVNSQKSIDYYTNERTFVQTNN
jgi:dTDP-4-dehydrorhamnose reductase